MALQISDLPARCIHVHLIYPNTSNAHGTVIVSILHITKTKDTEMVLGQVYPAGEPPMNSYYYHGIQDLSRSGPCQSLQHPQLPNTVESGLHQLISKCGFVPTWLCIRHSLPLESSSLHLALSDSCSSLKVPAPMSSLWELLLDNELRRACSRRLKDAPHRRQLQVHGAGVVGARRLCTCPVSGPCI